MSRKKKNKKEEKKNTSNLILRTLLTVFLFVAALGVLFVGTMIISASFEEIDVDNYVMNLTSEVYYTDSVTGNPISIDKIYSNENRIWVSFLEMPQHLKDAAVAIEDERFYKHHGIDFKRTLGATFYYFIDRDRGYGGSTITQQVVKNITGNTDRSVERKIKEMWNSFRLERKMSKDQILELYLNTIYLSQGCNGVGAAAHMYFDKEASELTLAEAAAIVGITQYPTRYDPFLNPENNKEKQETILAKMLELGYIDKKEHDDAVAEKLSFVKSNMRTGTNFNSYFTDQVIMDVAKELAEKKSYDYDAAFKLLHTGGFKIYSTIDPEIQKAVDRVYQNSDNFKDGGQSAIVIIDPETGEVKAMSGGGGKKEGDFVLNRATMTLRQPGSSIKPLAVYAPALEYGIITPSTIYEDKKVTYGSWSPKNFYSGFRGNMTVTTAVKLSVNTVAVQILDELGVDKSFNFLKNKLGISSLVDSKTVNGTVLTDKTLGALALGGLTDGVSVYEMAGAYSAIANDGVYIRPHTFTRVVDKNGKVVLEADTTKTTAMSKDTALQMKQLMLGVTASGGTGVEAAISGVPVAGKTGTTDDNYDKWFAGITPYYVGVTWYGFDIPKDMGYYSYNPAINLWKKVMTDVHSGLPSKSFAGVKTTVNVEICNVSGKVATDICVDAEGKPTTTHKSFYYTSVPSQSCSIEEHEKAGEAAGEEEETPPSAADELKTPTEPAETDPLPVSPPDVSTEEAPPPVENNQNQ